MSSSAGSSRRIRPVTLAILAWMLIMVAGIVGAWQGTEARYGVIPEITASSGGESVAVPPVEASELSGEVHENPPPELAVEADGYLSLRLPPELKRSSHWIFEVRDDQQFERYVPAGEGDSPILIDATTPDGRLDAVVIGAQVVTFDAEGAETVLIGEWGLEIEQIGEDVPVEGLPQYGEPVEPSADPADPDEIPDDGFHQGL